MIKILGWGFTTVLCLTNHKVEHVKLLMQMTGIDGLQIEHILAFSQMSLD